MKQPNATSKTLTGRTSSRIELAATMDCSKAFANKMPRLYSRESTNCSTRRSRRISRGWQLAGDKSERFWKQTSSTTVVCEVVMQRTTPDYANSRRNFKGSLSRCLNPQYRTTHITDLELSMNQITIIPDLG